MPRGVYARKPKTDKFRGKLDRLLNVQPAPAVIETDEEIEAKLVERFEVLADMTQGAIEGDIRAMIVSGPGGLGKSYTVDKTLAAWDPEATDYTVVKGYVKTPSLYKLLYNHRAPGQVLVLDDADSIFNDDTSINLLKAACDSSERRMLSYMSEYILIDDETAERLPKTFQFEGTIIFITNMDFDVMIDRGHRLAPHLEALVSRAHYIDMAMKTQRDYLVQIRLKVKAGLLENIGLDAAAQADVVEFIEKNYTKLRELSLRMALKIGSSRRRNRANWQRQVRVTCMR
jgi:hypothetical protein